MEQKMKQLSLKEGEDKFNLDINSYIGFIKSDKCIPQLEMENVIDKLKRSEWKCSPMDAFNVFENLINSKTTEVKFHEILSLFPQDPAFSQKILRRISIEAFNIQEFYINQNPDSLPGKIEEYMWTDISIMRSLQTLEITDFYFILHDLMETCKTLKFLRTLDVKIHPLLSNLPLRDDNWQGKFRQSFGQLESFFFSSLWYQRDSGKIFQTVLTRICVEKLLNLQYFGKLDFFVDMSWLCRNLTSTSQLRQLTLKMDKFEEKSCTVDMFPFITSLYIKWSASYNYRPVEETKLKSLQQFRQLNSLKLENLKSPAYLNYFLNTYGKELTKLVTVNAPKCVMMVELKTVQELCPKLESLHIHETNIFKDIAFSMEKYTKLYELKITFDINSTSVILLSDLLAPPALKIVCLTHLKVSKEDLLVTLEKTIKKEILGRIRDLHLKVIVEGTEIVKKAIKAKGDELAVKVRDLHPQAKAMFEIE